ncbi:MAG: winged helix-turn-helix domain-containing protein, partial [Myxococcota bacterium]
MARGILRLTGCTVDLDRQRIVRDGQEDALTGREFAMLCYFVDRRGDVVSRDQLLTEVWGYAEGVASRAVDAAVRRLRVKIEVDPSKPDHLIGIHGEGYRLVWPEATPTPHDPDLVGRHDELAQIDELLRTSRLVTLVGPGGGGKTRLAQAVEARWAGEVLFCPLADCRDQADLEATLVRALGVDEVEAIPRALAARPQLLLVLDNFEQLLAVAPAVEPWASVATTLVTSRAPLGIARERVVDIRPLSLTDAAELFVRRSVRALSDDEGAELEPLLQALDCLPLAIELAAARTTLLRPAELLERLKQGRTVLKDPRATAEPR